MGPSLLRSTAFCLAVVTQADWQLELIVRPAEIWWQSLAPSAGRLPQLPLPLAAGVGAFSGR